MAWLAEYQDTFVNREPDDNTDDWGSDFEESCSQEVEDNKINEIREAKLLKNSAIPVQALNTISEDSSQTVETITSNSVTNALRTGAIPKGGFSYLNSTTNVNANKVERKKLRNSVPIAPRQTELSSSHSQNELTISKSAESQSLIQMTTNNNTEVNKTPGKLKPEAFSFLNKLPRRNVSENGSEVSKERETLVPTAFSHAENVNGSQTQNESSPIPDVHAEAFISNTPSASINYEAIAGDTSSDFTSPPTCSLAVKEDIKPPLPARPPPIFKYPPETFSSSRSTTIESTRNVASSQSAPSYPKFGHSISLTDSDLKGKQNKISKGEEKNRKSFPSIAVSSGAPSRPLPPLPVAGPENECRIHPRLERPFSYRTDEKNLEYLPPIDKIANQQTTKLSSCEPHLQQTVSQVVATQEQLISNPQQRLAQILTNQTSVDSKVILSQKMITSAINSKAAGSQSSYIAGVKKDDESEPHNALKSQELNSTITSRTSDNDAQLPNEDESEQHSNLEPKETMSPRRYTDHETLLETISRPMLPQKAVPMQRSVSCNSLVQSIKDLSLSVWIKPEKKRNSHELSLPKKGFKSPSAASSAKFKPTVPLSITLISPDAPSEAANLSHHGKNYPTLSDEKSAVQEYPWFHDVDAKEGQLRLLSVGQDGTFLVRPSSRPTEDIRNTLCILYNGKVRNLYVRTTADGRCMLGTKHHTTFPTLSEMIRHHQEVPVEISPQVMTQLKPQLYKILLKDTPPKLQKRFV